MINAFIWDVDGTLFDTYPFIYECYKTILESHSSKLDMEIIKEILIRESSKEAIEYIVANSDININSISDFIKEYAIISSNDEKLKLIKPMPYIIDILNLIKKRNLKSYIVTNRDITTMKILDYNQMQGYFEDVVFIGSRNEAKRKPDVSSFNYLIKSYDLNPNETLSIGDRDLDVITSQKANLKTCIVNPIKGFKSKPDYVANDFEKLYNLIQNL